MASNSGSSPGDVFDVRRLRKFIALMNEHDLSEVDLRQGDQRIRLRRGPEVVSTAGVAPVVSVPPAGAAVGGVGTTPSPAVALPAEEDANSNVIRSPMVGTFYSSPSPEAPPFVKVGDQVGPESIVCIVEAMKVFNEIPAECSGKIVAVLAASGDSVEYNQPLFRVAPNV
jgi:acetyl-CoA carboxylase biotin carboxyl carrier protein